jgi:alpha-N-arabinofuranosidase
MSIHWYVGDQAGDPLAYMATSELIEERLSAYEGLMHGLTLGSSGRRLERSGQRRAIPLAVDEWNVWYRTAGDRTGTPPHLLEETYDLADALVVAMHLNAFIRHAATVRMANLAQLVNVIAPIVTSPDGLFLQTIFYPFELFSRTTGRIALDAWWDGDSFSGGEHQGVRTFDVSSSIDPDARRLSVHVVNRHQTDALEGVVELVGGRLGSCVEVSTISGSDLQNTNSVDRPDAVTTTDEQLEIRPAAEYRHVFPPRSVTGLVFTDLT